MPTRQPIRKGNQSVSKHFIREAEFVEQRSSKFFRYSSTPWVQYSWHYNLPLSIPSISQTQKNSHPILIHQSPSQIPPKNLANVFAPSHPGGTWRAAGASRGGLLPSLHPGAALGGGGGGRGTKRDCCYVALGDQSKCRLRLFAPDPPSGGARLSHWPAARRRWFSAPCYPRRVTTAAPRPFRMMAGRKVHAPFAFSIGCLSNRFGYVDL